MLILLSPAKTLDLTPHERDLPATKPEFHSEAKKLIGVAKELSPGQIKKLMQLSDKLADAAHGYFQSWKAKWDAQGAKQAGLTFRGDVYQSLDAESLADDDLLFAQDRVRLLSGLYGLLRPLDLIQPYRLEMGRAIKNPRGKDLYEFWGDRLRDAIEQAAHATDDPPLVVNLASKEYAKAARLTELEAPVVSPEFKDLSKGKYRVLGLFAKRARGMMTRYLVEKRASTVGELKKFRGGGYRLNAELSTPASPVFTRDQPSGS